MVRCLTKIEIVCGNPDAMAIFYEAALGFLRLGPFTGAPNGTPGSARLLLGKQEIALRGIKPEGRLYPANIAGWSPLFQHIAIVVSNMARAYAHLSTVPGWTPISTSGPQLLPSASGGVSAFKFRDPEGHPLELIEFATGTAPAQWRTASESGFLGIDHSAISVLNTSRSVTFYQDLGLHRSGGSFNVGPEQAKLDDVPNAIVEVTVLTPDQLTPHVELLCYRGDFDRRVQSQAAGDATATQLVFSVESRATLDALCARNLEAVLSDPVRFEGNVCRALLQDPDGHLICLEAED
jgi:catechol 2,3-dioxygenase-like lactoylglutathione lyase family enzyme